MKATNKQQLKYAVVTFIDDDPDNDELITSEVPQCWLAANKKKCWWPKAKDVRRLIAKSVPPSTKDPKWTLHNINFEGLYDNLEEARCRADVISSADEEVNLMQKMKLRQSICKTYKDDDSSDNEQSQIMEPPLLTTKKLKNCQSKVLNINLDVLEKSSLNSENITVLATNTPISEDVNRNPITDKPNVISNVKLTKPIVYNTFTEGFNMQNTAPEGAIVTNDELICISTDDLLRSTFDMIIEIKENMATKALVLALVETVAKLKIEVGILKSFLSQNPMDSQNTLAESNLHAFLQKLPFMSTVDLQEFEEQLNCDTSLANDFKHYLARIGGKNSKDCILKMLRKVFSSSCAKNCSWLGQRNNFKLQGLKTINILAETGRVHHPFTETFFEEVTSEWFRQGKQRDNRNKQREGQQL